MIKYVESAVTFEEIPTEVTLSLSISNCQNRCLGCHSPELRCNIGTELTAEELDRLIVKNKGVAAVLFLGEGNDRKELLSLAKRVRDHWKLKSALYSGRENVEDDVWEAFDYVKVGGYDEKSGALNSPTTNQRLYQYSPLFSSTIQGRKGWRDITYMFWKNKR